jgi:uncharacterized damage-inducible protein DinB
MATNTTTAPKQTTVINSENLLAHWQGHRNLTRKVIEAFPEKELFTFSIGGMRPFAALAAEMIGMARPGIVGILNGKWNEFKDAPAATKEELLATWDAVTTEINQLWPNISPDRFQEVDLAFGLYEGPVYGTLFYFIDNEIHHRGQGYVYLRALGIEPPQFWDRDSK